MLLRAALAIAYAGSTIPAVSSVADPRARADSTFAQVDDSEQLKACLRVLLRLRASDENVLASHACGRRSAVAEARLLEDVINSLPGGQAYTMKQLRSIERRSRGEFVEGTSDNSNSTAEEEQEEQS